MAYNPECEIASLLTALSTSSKEVASCPLSIFARDLRPLLQNRDDERDCLSDALARRSMELLREEERINVAKEMIKLTYDRLRAEIARIDAQMWEQESRLKEVVQQKKLCKLALNMFLSGEVPRFIDADSAAAPFLAEPPVRAMRRSGDSIKEEEVEFTPPAAASEPIPIKSPVAISRSSTAANKEKDVRNGIKGGMPEARPTHHNAEGASLHPLRPASSIMNATGLLALLRLPDVKETVLLNAMEAYEQQAFVMNKRWMASEAYPEILTVLLAMLSHLSVLRPPVQLGELCILGNVLQAVPTGNSTYDKNLLIMLDVLVKKGDAITVLTKLLRSVNDDVKCEVLESLSALVGSSCSFSGPLPETDALCLHVCNDFINCSGLEYLVNIVTYSTSEMVLERALVLLWTLLSKDENLSTNCINRRSIRSEVRMLGGLRVVLDLLYTDFLAILENVCMVIGYLTREDTSKREIRDIGGLEKITATLRHPSDSIKTKMAGAVWNCSSDSENRTCLRQLGVIPALLELLKPNSAVLADAAAYEFVRENVAGALWNLSVCVENKAQILEYGGIPILIQVIVSSKSTPVLENLSGTLWNCSALAEIRPAIRKAGGIPILISLIDGLNPSAGGLPTNRHTAAPPAALLNEKILDNAVGTLRNCAIDDQNKSLIRENGGVELLLHKIKGATLICDGKVHAPLLSNTLERLVSTLWILSTSLDIKQAIAQANGIETLTKVLEMSSSVCTAAQADTKAMGSLFPLSKLLPEKRLGTQNDFYQTYFAPSVLRKIPSSPPLVEVNMSIKEKIIGVLRNCSTVTENRVSMISCGTVRSLVAVILDCYSSYTTFCSNAAGHKNASRPHEPSVQLKETISSALWYLSRDDKVIPREEGGLELMCMFLVEPQQPAVVLEQAAGALSSLAVNSPENRDAIRRYGGLEASLQLVVSKAIIEYLPRNLERGANKQDAMMTPTYVMLNALLTIRNAVVDNQENTRYCSEAAVANDAKIAHALLHILQYGSEESFREAALIIRNICVIPSVLEWFVASDAVSLLNSFLKKVSSGSVRRAATSALQALCRVPSKR